MALRHAVKAMREAMGLTRDQFAERVGVDVRTIFRWELENVEPSPMAIKHLRRVRAEHEREKQKAAANQPSDTQPVRKELTVS